MFEVEWKMMMGIFLIIKIGDKIVEEVNGFARREGLRLIYLF